MIIALPSAASQLSAHSDLFTLNDQVDNRWHRRTKNEEAEASQELLKRSV